MTMPLSDDVVLLDESGRPVASVSRSAVHPTEKPVHLFFSCHVLNSSGQVLLTRRRPSANGEAWTSSFDGHPREAEPVVTAVRRRADHSLGLELDDLELALSLRYRSTGASGADEMTMCPVYIASCSAEPAPHPLEIADHTWADPGELGEAIRSRPWDFSPSLVFQASVLPLLGGSSAGLASSGRRTEHRALA